MRRLPLAFKGGNVLVDELAGTRIVFCGYDQQLIRKNISMLESLGYTVCCVPTQAYKLTGGIHCLVNVLR